MDKNKIYAIKAFVKLPPQKEGYSRVIYKGKTYKGCALAETKKLAEQKVISALLKGIQQHVPSATEEVIKIRSCELFNDFKLS